MAAMSELRRGYGISTACADHASTMQRPKKAWGLKREGNSADRDAFAVQVGSVCRVRM